MLVLAAGYWRFRTTPFNWSAFAANFRDVDWAWAGLSILLILVSYAGRALRWEIMIRPLRTGLTLWQLVSYTLIGFTAVVLTGRPGELVRPYLIAARAKAPLSTQIAAWVIERMLDLMMVLLLFGLALAQVQKGAAAPGSNLQLILRIGGWLIGLLTILTFSLLLGFRHFRGRAQQRITDALSVLPASVHVRVSGFLHSFSTGMEALRSSSALLTLIVYSIIEWGVIGMAFFALFQSFPATAHLSITDVVVTLGFVAFGSAVQIPGIGGGMQVAAVFVLTELYQLSFEAASGVALALWLVNYVSIVPMGITLAVHEGLNWHKLKDIEEEVGSDQSLRQ